MSQLDFDVSKTDLKGLPTLEAKVKCTFDHSEIRPAWLRPGAVVYRYGSSIGQVKRTRDTWLNVTEDRFEIAEDALQNCSLLAVTLRDIGERDFVTGDNLVAGGVREAWNNAALRGALTPTVPLLVWTGQVRALLFDLHKGVPLTRGMVGTALHSTSGSASQILVHASQQDMLSLVGKPVVLPRVKYLN